VDKQTKYLIMSNKLNKSKAIFVLAFFLLALPKTNFSQTPNGGLNLGILSSFLAFSGSGGIANTGGTVEGDVGTHDGVISGLILPDYTYNAYNGNTIPGNIITAQAREDVMRLYIHVFDLFVDFPSTHAPAFGAGETIPSGVYSTIGAGSLSGNLTLDGGGDPNAKFVLRFNGAFTVGAGATIILTGGTQSCNVFFVANGAFSIAASANLKGTFLAKTGALGLGEGTILEGRLLTMAGAITFGVGCIATLTPCVSTIPIFCEASCSPAPAVDVLGSVSDFAFFTSVGAIANTAISGVNGKMGTNSGVISGYSTGIHIGTEQIMNAATAQAAIDLDTAYNKLMALTNTVTSHAAVFGGGETLTAGVYYTGGAGSLGGTITLDAQNNPGAIFVFKFAGALSIVALSKIILANGANRCNVFWISGAGVTTGALNIGAASHLKGNFIAHNGACNSGAGVFLSGRQLSTTGAINSNDGIIYDNPECVTSETLGITAVADAPPAINGATGGTTTSLTANDLLGGLLVVIGATSGDVILTGVTVPAGLTLNANGTVTVAPNTSVGNYSLTYKICEVIRPTNCSSAIATIAVCVSTVSAASATPTLCINIPLTAITHTTTGATGIGSTTGLPTGVTAAFASNMLTISGTPTASGTFNYSITLTGDCESVSATGTVTVTVAPNAGTLSGTQSICVGSTTTFSSTSVGGTWTTSNAAVATVNSSTGDVYGVAVGTATITYTVNDAGDCVGIDATDTRTVTVTAAANAGTLSGNQIICISATSTFSSTTSGGSWTTSNGSVATVNSSSGVVTGVAIGSATITYTVTGTGVCADETATRLVTVSTLPSAGALSGTQTTCEFTTTTFQSTISGGSWSTSNPAVATVNSSTGVVTGIGEGNATITYTITGTGGCSNATATATRDVSNSKIVNTAILQNGDYIWKGGNTGTETNDRDWLTASNWLNYNGSLSTTIQLPTATTNVIIPPTSACNTGQPHIYANVTPVSKSLTILDQASLTSGSGTLTVNGDWVNNGTWIKGTGLVIFAGIGYHNIGGTVTVNAYHNFRMNKPDDVATKSVAYLSKQATISGVMTLDLGLFDINVFSIDMDDRAVVGGSNNSYVRTSDVGFLRRYIGSAYANLESGYVRFPVGRSNFNLAKMNNSGTSDKFSVRVFDNVTDDSKEMSATTALPVVERTWIIEEETTGASDVDMQLYWNGTISSRVEEINAFDYNTAYIAHYDVNSPTWENKGGSAPDGPGYAQQNGIVNFSPFTISSEGGLGQSPLPVELLNFEAKCLEDNSVKIDWSTASENNSSHFDVRKSFDGFTWETIETVPSAGNSTELLSYSVIDRSMTNGNVYYRLKQVDIDGQYEIFDIVNTNCGEEINANLLNIYPNPSSEEFYVDFNSIDLEEKATISVTDSKGMIVYSKDVWIEKGANFFIVDTIKGSEGIYFVQLTSDNYKSKVLKQLIR